MTSNISVSLRSQTQGSKGSDPSGTILAVDVGNTSTHFALMQGLSARKEFRIQTDDLAGLGARNIYRILRGKFPLDKIPMVAIASVVPSAGNFLKKSLSPAKHLKVYLLGKDVKVPIINKYKRPSQVGVDRLLNALAAYQEFKKELIIVDFGTAITLDVVSKKGEYLGGIIAPGIEISLEALFQKTALLPKIKLAHPHNWIGKDTVESIRIGCSVGIGGLCDRVIEEVSHRYGLKPTVVATGGYAQFMSTYCRRIQKIDPTLIMKGIVLACQGLMSFSPKMKESIKRGMKTPIVRCVNQLKW